MERLPHLRLLVAHNCDGKCFFCPGSEGAKGNPNIILSREEIKFLAKISAQVGFRHVVISGGDPLQRNDIVNLLKDIKELGKFETIRMVTRGLRLEEKVSKLKEAGLDVITVSLDAATPRLFRKIFGIDGLEKVLKGIEECKKVDLPIVINTVLIKSNLEEIPRLIQLAQRIEAKLKLIDLMDLKRDPHLWLREYISLRSIDKWLRRISVKTDVELPSGGLGSPMKRYILKNGTQIITRDATVGTWYGAKCFSCKYYPCQDALISLRITPDGKLRTCLLRNDHLVDVLQPLRNGEFEVIRERIKDAFLLLKNAKFFPHRWSFYSQVKFYRNIQKISLEEVPLGNT